MDYDEVVEGAATADPLEFARTLAAALAEYSAGASVRGGAQPIPPAESARRKKAAEDLEALLAGYEGNGATPRYRITTAAPGGFFIDDILIEGGQEIEFLGIPNQEMEPLNAPAREAFALYMESIGGGGLDIGDEAYNAYANRPRHAAIVGQRNEPPPLGTPRAVSRAHVVGEDRQNELPGVTPGQASILHPNGNRPRDPANGRYNKMPEP